MAEQNKPDMQGAPDEVLKEQEKKPASKREKKEPKEVRELKDQLAAAAQEAAETKEQLLRLSAEYDNFKKRTAKERDGIYADAACATVTKLIGVLDNLERAVDAAKENEEIAKGIALVQSQFLEALAGLGVAEENPENAPFNPNLHNAVMHIEDEAAGEGQVVEVFQKGYIMGERVVRYAMVKVAN